MFLPYLSVLLLIVAIALFIISSQQRRRSGIPGGNIIYTDTSKWGKVEKPLFEPTIRLVGKPDYLVDQGTHILPVEVKSGKAPQEPYDSHIYQLAAYCLLVEHEYGTRPDRGLIHYQNRTYSIEYTSDLESSVKSIINEMQALTSRSQVNRSHDEPNRCRHCGYRSICDQSLRI